MRLYMFACLYIVSHAHRHVSMLIYAMYSARTHTRWPENRISKGSDLLSVYRDLCATVYTCASTATAKIDSNAYFKCVRLKVRENSIDQY